MEKQFNVRDHNTSQADQNSTGQQSSLPKKSKVIYLTIGLTVLVCFFVFGFGGYYLSKNQYRSTNTTDTPSLLTPGNFSTSSTPEANTLYRGTVKLPVQTSVSKTEEDIEVVFLTNWKQGYAAGIPDDPFTGKLYGRKIHSTGSETKIDTYSDFRKIEKPMKIISFGQTPVNKLYDTLISNLNNKIFVFVSFSSETRDGKPKYSLYEINTSTFNLKEIWSYDLENNPLHLNSTEISPSFGKLTDNKYLTFSIDGYFNSWEGQMVVLNLETGTIKYLPKSIEVKVDTSTGSVSYKPITNLSVEFYPGGGYSPQQIKDIESATGQIIEEPLP